MTHLSDPCPHCGLARDAVPVGECRGAVERLQQLHDQCIMARGMVSHEWFGSAEEERALAAYWRSEDLFKAALAANTAEIERWNADARRLSGGLLAIHSAAPTVSAEVLRGIAYDVALNCMDGETAEYQIIRRAQAEGGHDDR